MAGQTPCAVLLLEDEPLILMDLEMAVEDSGCTPLPASSVVAAFDAISRAEAINVAVLDVNLGPNETCLPIAMELQRRQIPYILHSGDLDRQDEMVRDLSAELVAKPACSSDVIARALAAAGLPNRAN